MKTAYRSLRAGFRLVAAAILTLISYLLALVARGCGIFSRRFAARGQGWAYQFWSRSLCWVFSVRVAVRGTPPTRPFFLASNHLSYIDVLALGTQLPCVFVAKAEIDGWPIFGAICRSVNTIFIDRKVKRKLPQILQRIDESLAAGQGVVVFPEGTSGAGDRVMPFRSPLLEFAMNYPGGVHHAAISYRAPAGETPTHLSVCWWGDMPLGAHLREFLWLPSVAATIDFGSGGEGPKQADDRKKLTAELHAAVVAGFEPCVSEEEVERLRRLKTEDPQSLPRVLRNSPDRFS
ncbi:MAG: lysophospholipid acyltransferase family protein [Thermoanaerobaculia bacterium]